MSDASGVAARDDLAGVVDLFGWFTREELSRALSELAFKQRSEVDEDAIAAAIDVAVAEYVLVPAPPAALAEDGSPPDGVGIPDVGDEVLEPGDGVRDDEEVRGADDETRGTNDAEREPTDVAPDVALAVGPAAFPSLPSGAEDLPHILDVPERGVDRETLADAVFDRLSADAIAAIGAEDTERLETLVDVTYDIEAWAPVDAGPIRERILDEIDG
ncbi:hypothetical protein GJ633_12955 [Halorubrum sp. CBA1125]|uniref:DUF7109 family protein n=1 Tax=Halorubrum sp. CBA1125 TaxID=2668072 RepID=UPI0012E8EDF4|nr:hypothetical protein [Halorubrum sp. CBA1125]MUW15445.1 hypothetical protein [Halorubrum sp. CBA1125]